MLALFDPRTVALRKSSHLLLLSENRSELAPHLSDRLRLTDAVYMHSQKYSKAFVYMLSQYLV